MVDRLREEIKGGRLKSGLEIRTQLKASIVGLLQQCGCSDLVLPDAKPAVILIVGVNGGGKTTTIGKLSHQFVSGGASVPPTDPGRIACNLHPHPIDRESSKDTLECGALLQK